VKVRLVNLDTLQIHVLIILVLEVIRHYGVSLDLILLDFLSHLNVFGFFLK
jgi:hypothetical protein